jgi:GAF domain-containing protein
MSINGGPVAGAAADRPEDDPERSWRQLNERLAALNAEPDGAARLSLAVAAAAELTSAGSAAWLPASSPDDVLHSTTDPVRVQRMQGLLRAYELTGADPDGRPHQAEATPSFEDPRTSVDRVPLLVAPVATAEGEVGVLCAAAAEGAPFSPRHLVLLTNLAAHLGLALHAAATAQAASSRGGELAALREVDQRLLSDPEDVAGVARSIVEHIHRLGRAQTVTFAGPSRISEPQFEVRLAAGVGAADLVRNLYDKDRTLEGLAMQENRGFLGSVADGHCHHVDAAPQDPVDSVIAVPVDGPDDLRGAIVATRSASQAPFDTDDLLMVQDFARRCSLALQLADSGAQKEQLNFHEDHDTEVRQLHDDLIQQLFWVGVTLEALRQRALAAPGVDSSPAGSALWQQIADRIDHMISALRAALTASAASYN